MTDFRAGDVYQIKLKPWKNIDPREYASDYGPKIYQDLKAKTWLKVLVMTIPDKHGRFEAFFYARDFYTSIYLDWIAKKKFVERLRDLSEWPGDTKVHFLVKQGARIDESLKSIEDARHSIARNERLNKICELNEENNAREQGLEIYFGDEQEFLEDDFAIEVDFESELPEPSPSPRETRKIKYKSDIPTTATSYSRPARLAHAGYGYFEKKVAAMKKETEADWKAAKEQFENDLWIALNNKPKKEME